MARLINLGLVAAMLMVVISRAAAVEYIVGDEMGWQTPDSPDVYAAWASKHSFAVGDVLVFNFLIGTHTVAESEQTQYENCDATNVIEDHVDGPVKITLKKQGQNYFFCTIHCLSGQKLTIDVLATSTAHASGDEKAPTLAPSTDSSMEPSRSDSSSTEPSSSLGPSSSDSPAGAPSQGSVKGNSAVSVSSSGAFFFCLSFVMGLLF